MRPPLKGLNKDDVDTVAFRQECRLAIATASFTPSPSGDEGGPQLWSISGWTGQETSPAAAPVGSVRDSSVVAS
jgi:hypothetical protein